jgi:heat-inducible transcriptional repressor
MTDPDIGLAELDLRSRDIFKRLVETYLETGEPVGSRTISQFLPTSLSPASVRNVMSDLEALGLIFAPHKSAGRMPTEIGLRLFVDGFLELGNLTEDERQSIAAQMKAIGTGGSVEDMLTQASNLLSGLSHCAGVVVAPKVNLKLKHIEFVSLDAARALAVLVGEDGSVENRVIDLPPGMPAATLIEAGNYLNAHILGKTIDQAQKIVQADIENKRTALDQLTAKVVEAGLAVWSGGDDGQDKTLIVRGRSNLLEDVSMAEDLDRIRMLFDDLESKRELISLLGLAENAEGVRIFIGSENKLFSLSGSSLIVSPYRDGERKIIGAVGVIGPTRLNYARIIPMVDYTARVLGRILT